MMAVAEKRESKTGVSGGRGAMSGRGLLQSPASEASEPKLCGLAAKGPPERESASASATASESERSVTVRRPKPHPP